MSAERPKIPSSAEQISGLNPPESSSENITLQVSISDKKTKPMERKVPHLIFKRIVGWFEEKGIKPEVVGGVVVLGAAITAGIVAKKAYVEFKERQSQEINIPTLTKEQREEFGEMYQNTHLRIRSFISNKLRGVPVEDIEDLTGRVFENALRHFPPKTTHPNNSNPHLSPHLPWNPYLPWLHTIAGNLVKNRYRDSLAEKKRTVEPIDEDIFPDTGSALKERQEFADLTLRGIPDTESIVEKREESAELQTAISSLKYPYPLIIWLKSLLLSHEEIAHLIGTTESGVKSTYHRATERLREIYSKKSDF